MGDSLRLLVAAVATLTFCRISKRLPQYVMSWGMPLSSSTALLCTFLLLLFPPQHATWPWYFYFIFFRLAFSVSEFFSILAAGNKYFIRRCVRGVQNLHHRQVSLGTENGGTLWVALSWLSHWRGFAFLAIKIRVGSSFSLPIYGGESGEIGGGVWWVGLKSRKFVLPLLFIFIGT